MESTNVYSDSDDVTVYENAFPLLPKFDVRYIGGWIDTPTNLQQSIGLYLFY